MVRNKKKKVDKKVVFSIVIIILAVSFTISLFIKDPKITGEAKYSGGVLPCSVSGRSYQKCMWVYLENGENEIIRIPWASKTIEGVEDYVQENIPGASIDINTEEWIKLENWLEERIYEDSPDALINLGWYSKKDGSTNILIGWNYEVTDSWWTGWKWVDVHYEFYYENGEERMSNNPYAQSKVGFYYNPKTNEVSH